MDTSHAKAFKAFMFLIVPLSAINGYFAPLINFLVTRAHIKTTNKDSQQTNPDIQPILFPLLNGKA